MNKKYISDVSKKSAVTKNNNVAAYQSSDILLLTLKDKRIVTILNSYDNFISQILYKLYKQD